MKNIRALKYLAVSATVLAIGLTTTSVNAQLAGIIQSGGLLINVDFFSQGTTVKGQAAGAKEVAPGVFEDTWGIFQITSIKNNGTSVFKNDGSQGQLLGLFYGDVDTAGDPVPLLNPFTGFYDQRFVGQGLQVDIYSHTNAANFDLLALSGAPSHTALDQYTGITNGGTLASANPVLSASLAGNLNSVASFDTPAGNNLISTNAFGKLDVTYNGLFNLAPGLQLNPLSFTFTGQAPTTGEPFLTTGGGDIGGQVTAVPEPSTYTLAGVAALMGVIAVRRIRAKKSAVAQ